MSADSGTRGTIRSRTIFVYGDHDATVAELTSTALSLAREGDDEYPPMANPMLFWRGVPSSQALGRRLVCHIVDQP